MTVNGGTPGDNLATMIHASQFADRLAIRMGDAAGKRLAHMTGEEIAVHLKELIEQDPSTDWSDPQFAVHLGRQVAPRVIERLNYLIENQINQELGTAIVNASSRREAGKVTVPKAPKNGRAKKRRRLSNRYWTEDLIIERIHEWAQQTGLIPRAKDWSPTRARAQGENETAEAFEAADGYWPNVSTVQDLFGSWNAAMVAAGYKSRGGVRPPGSSRYRQTTLDREGSDDGHMGRRRP